MRLPSFARSLAHGLVAAAAMALVAEASADRPKPQARSQAQKEGGIAGAGPACSCDGDFNLDGIVDGADLATLLGNWSGSTFDLTGDGTVDGADIAVLLGAWGPCGAPINDNCNNSIDVFAGQDVPFCTVYATELAQGVTGSCGAFANSIYNDVWYTFVPVGNGELTLSTCGTADFDTVIAVYTSIIPGLNSCPPLDGEIGTSTLVGCNDDTDDCGGGVVQSKLTVDVVAGKAYQIRLGGYNGGSGSGELQVSFKSVGAFCFDGIVVQGSDEQTVTITGTTADNYLTSPPCGLEDSKGEWITYFPGCEHQNITVSTCHPETDFDTVVTVYRESVSQGCDGILIECEDDTELTACLLNGNFRKSKLSFTANAGEVYHILIGGYSESSQGNYKVTITTDCF